MRTLARRILLGLSATLVALLLAEAALRAFSMEPFPSWSPRYLHVGDDALGLVPAAHFSGRQESSEYSVAIRTNSLGLRSPEPTGEPGVDVVLLGDSFAFGQGVERERTSAHLLGVELGAAPGAPPHAVRVHNAGVMSYGTRQAVGRLRRLAAELDPDLCILLFFAGNDPLDNVRPPLEVRAGYVVGSGRSLPWWRRVQLEIKFRWSVYRVLARAVDRRAIPGRCSDHASFGFDLFLREETPRVAGAWRATEEALADLVRLTRGLGCPLVVAAVPTRYQVDPAWWRVHGDACGFEDARFDLERVQERLRVLCSDLDVPFLDVLPVFRGAAGEDRLYFEALLDMHLNAAGHALLARELAAFLRERKLVPER